jgi:hypothetical protein
MSRTPCQHLYHRRCLIKWLISRSANSDKCPGCRRPLIRIPPVYDPSQTYAAVSRSGLSLQGNGRRELDFRRSASSPLPYHMRDATRPIESGFQPIPSQTVPDAQRQTLDRVIQQLLSEDSFIVGCVYRARHAIPILDPSGCPLGLQPLELADPSWSLVPGIRAYHRYGLPGHIVVFYEQRYGSRMVGNTLVIYEVGGAPVVWGSTG